MCRWSRSPGSREAGRRPRSDDPACWPRWSPGVIIGAVEVVLAVAFAAFVFGGVLVRRSGRRHRAVPRCGRADARGSSRGGRAPEASSAACRTPRRPCSRSWQRAGAAKAAAIVQGRRDRRRRGLRGSRRLPDRRRRDAGRDGAVRCRLPRRSGRFRLGNLVRFVPYPVVGGFLAGTGWLLFKGGIYVASGVEVHLRTHRRSWCSPVTLKRWVPAFVFGVILLVAVRQREEAAGDPDRDRRSGSCCSRSACS